jgi:hypothetical protein
MLSLSGNLRTLSIEQLCVVGIRVLFLEMTDLITKLVLFRLRSVNQSVELRTLAIVNGVPCKFFKFLDLFQGRLQKLVIALNLTRS